jgi:hypothetical protein
MCYSAEVYAAYDKYVVLFGARMSIKEFYELFYRRGHDPEAKIKVPKAMELAFAAPKTDEERAVTELIDDFNAREATRIEQELFAPSRRRASACDEDHKGGHGQQTHRDGQDLEGYDEAERPPTNGVEAARLTYFPRRVCASHGDGRRRVGGHADALPVPPNWQARLLRHEVSRDVQRFWSAVNS